MFSNHFFKRYWFKIWMSIWANLVVFFFKLWIFGKAKTELRQRVGNTQDHWLMQDGASSYMSRLSLQWISENFPGRVISLQTGFLWAPTPHTSIILCYLNEIWLSFYFDCRFFSNNHFNLKFQALIVHKPNMILWKNQQNHLIADDFITMGPLFFETVGIL